MTLLALGEGSIDGFLGAAPLVRPLDEPKLEEPKLEGCAQHCHHPRQLIAGATHAVKRWARGVVGPRFAGRGVRAFRHRYARAMVR
jgi:hypothetical protein